MAIALLVIVIAQGDIEREIHARRVIALLEKLGDERVIGAGELHVEDVAQQHDPIEVATGLRGVGVKLRRDQSAAQECCRRDRQGQGD